MRTLNKNGVVTSRKTVNYRHLLGVYGLLRESNKYFLATQGFGFCDVIRTTVPLSRLVWQAPMICYNSQENNIGVHPSLRTPSNISFNVVYCFMSCSKILHSYGNVKVTISGTVPHQWINSRVGRNPQTNNPSLWRAAKFNRLLNPFWSASKQYCIYVDISITTEEMQNLW